MLTLHQKFKDKYSILPIQNKIYVILSLLSVFFAIFSTFANIVVNAGLLQIIMSNIMTATAVYFLYISLTIIKINRKRFFSIIIMIVIIFPFFWIIGAGSYGYVPYLYLISSLLIALLLNIRESIIAFIIQFITVLVLIIVEYNYPSIIIPYTSELLRTIDVAISFFIITSLIFISLSIIIREYNETIKELTLAKKQLETISNMDALSGIYNRRFLMKKLERCVLNNDNISTIMFDIDNFKMINDTYGHAIGDTVIKEVSSVLAANIRSEDIVGRIGGEEFLVILNNSNYTLAKSKAENLRKLIANHTWMFKDLNVTISGGVYSKKDTDDIEKILTEVDMFLYKSKNEGKNKIS